jgi:hypothetical protein
MSLETKVIKKRLSAWPAAATGGNVEQNNIFLKKNLAFSEKTSYLYSRVYLNGIKYCFNQDN